MSPSKLLLWRAMGGYLVCIGNLAAAGEIYKCDIDGKTVYAESPRANGNCQPVRLMNTGPNAEDVARAVEEKERKKAEEEAAEQEARDRVQQELEQRDIAAREKAAEAANRRARAAEEELQMLKRQQTDPYYQPYYPLFVPGFPNGPPPHDHPPRPPHPRPPAPPPTTSNPSVVGGSAKTPGGVYMKTQ